MTFKEKLAIEHSSKINPTEIGGCEGCPSDYGYDSKRFCLGSEMACSTCWNREIPEDKEQATTDMVNSPSHYCKGGFECIDVIRAAISDITDPFEAYCTGNIIKYIWRWNDKNGVEDLNKAKQYADIIIEYRASKDKPETGNPISDKPNQFTDEEAQDPFGKENTEDKA